MSLFDKIDDTVFRSLKREGKGLYVSYGSKPLNSSDPGIPAPSEESNFDSTTYEIQARRDDVIRVTKATITRNPSFWPKQAVLYKKNEGTGGLFKNLSREKLLSAGKEIALGTVSTIAQTGLSEVDRIPFAGRGTRLNPGYKLEVADGEKSQFVDNESLSKVEKFFKFDNRGDGTGFKLSELSLDSLGRKGIKTRDDRTDEEIESKKSTYDASIRLDNRLGYDSNSDFINSLDIQTEPLVDKEKQIIPFEIAVYDPGNIEVQEYLYFRAYLENLSDSFNGTWNSNRYIGRAEELFNYNGFSRDISFGFKMAAHSKDDMYPLYDKLNRLVGSTSPSYSDDQSFMRGIFIKLTIGDYLKRVPGFFTNIGVTWNTAYPWEIGIDENGLKNNTPRVPHILDVSLSFKPVHEFNPSYKQPFISHIPKGDVIVEPLQATGNG